VKAEIEGRLAANLKRVQHLMELHRRSASGPKRLLDTTDMLRAAVVLLHATLEDFLRSLLEWKLPEAEPAHLRDVPLAGKKPRSTFTLEDLASFRGFSIDEVIVQSVQANLERSMFNDPGEVAQAFARIGLDATLLATHKDALGTLMARRHWIVHRADRSTSGEHTPGATQELQHSTIAKWYEGVRLLTRAVLREL
jgi:hypothetical protein